VWKRGRADRWQLVALGSKGLGERKEERERHTQRREVRVRDRLGNDDGVRLLDGLVLCE
jgi:hypothetical protein